MNYNLPLRPKNYIIYSCLCTLFYFGNAQTIETLTLEHYEKIEKSNDPYPKKVIAIDQLLELEKSNIDSIQLGDLYFRYGRFNHGNKDYKQAIINSKKALKIQKKFMDSLPQLVNNTYNNLAYHYRHSEDETNAIKTFKTLIEQPHKDKFTTRACTVGLANLLIERGDYYKLLEYIKETEHTIIKKNNTTLNKELYSVYLGFSEVYYKIEENRDSKNYHNTIKYLNKAEKTITHLSGEELRENESIIYNRYGMVYDELKEYDKAISNYNKTLSLKLISEKENASDIAKIYNNLGVAYKKTGKREIAYTYYQKAIQSDSLNTSTFNNLGDYYLHHENYKQALTYYQKAIQYSYENYDDADFNELPSLKVLLQSEDKIGLVNYLTDKAKAWLQFYTKTQTSVYLEHALATISRADELIDIIRSESYEQQSKFFWRKEGVDLYMLATSICYQLNQSENAFYYIEKSKSLSLLENLTHEEAKKLGGLPEVLQEKEHSLKYEILLASQKSIEDTTFTEKDRQSLVFKKKRNYEEFLKSLEKKYPSYYKYKKGIDLISYRETQQKVIEKNTIMIQYILSDEQGYGMYIDSDTTSIFKIPNIPLLQKEILDLNKLLHQPLFSIEDQKKYKNISFSITSQLLPFLTDIESYKGKKMTIIPDHILQYIPFEVLVINPNIKKVEDGYLINFIETNYQYSMSLYKNTDAIVSSTNQNLLGFAPISFENHKLSSLKRSENKMNEIQKLFGGTVYMNKKASKNTFIKKSNDYKTIHLSTHASSMDTDEPWIAFHDEKLSLKELYFIKNQAELVILDACRTGIGELQSGEGIMSLTRGFFHSGAKSVVSSLWNTNEKSNNEIVLNFYKYLKKGFTKSSALHKSKLEYIQNHQGSEISPYFWGPLVLHGNNDTLLLTKNSQTNFWIYPFLLVLLFFMIFLVKRKFGN